LTRARIRLYTPNVFIFLLIVSIALLLAMYGIYRMLMKSESRSVRLLGNIVGGAMAVLTCVLALFVRPLVIETEVVTSDSMIPTLLVGDHIFVSKLAYKHREPRHGEIVLFTFPSTEPGAPEDMMIKRVIGLPGDAIEVRDGSLYRNDHRISETYIREPMQYELAKMTVPEGKLFALGDNRNESDDSHIWGFLDRGRLIGRVTIRFWPLKSMKSVK
jgi:signal peptidase I